MSPEHPITTVFHAPDGTHWRAYGRDSPSADVELYPVEQNADTGQWHRTTGPHRHLAPGDFLATYTAVPDEPLRDPRITRLTDLVTRLLADYEHTTGTPHDSADTVRAVLTDVAGIPEEARRRRHAAAQAAQHAGFHRGRGR